MIRNINLLDGILMCFSYGKQKVSGGCEMLLSSS